MHEKIRVGIIGYGNLGKGVELAIKKHTDMELVAIFTRRPVEFIEKVEKNTRILNTNTAHNYADDIDVVILCGGSATDLPVQGPYFASIFNTVDSYDNHKNIPEYFKAMDKASKTNNKTSAICVGWDPGLFSMSRLLFESILPCGDTYTFWGPGVSQGHSDAVRRVSGVKNAVQYTVPKIEIVKRIKKGEALRLNTSDMHTRDCYVVVEEGADKSKIIEEIKSMPNYFSGYDTNVFFITENELRENHNKMYHGGLVIRSGWTGKNYSNKHMLEFSLELDSNSEFTASILVTYARAVYRLNKEGNIGAKTVFDIPLKYISSKSGEELLQSLL